MHFLDANGHRLSGANGESTRLYHEATAELARLAGDPLAAAERAIQHAPGMPMAHVLKAWLNLIGTEPAGWAVARAACAAAAALPADGRERAHLAAAAALAHGRWAEAGRRLEDLTAQWPRDLLALQVGHQIDFFRGDARMLRDRIARALPSWDHGIAGWHAVLGMHAFGLEECGDLDGAERAGLAAVAAEPRDGWAWHAVAHVHEMRGEPAAGIAWLAPARETWSTGSFLAPHNTWHLALFHLDLDEPARTLALYDEAIGGTGSSVVLDLVDASAMLWRLRLRGIAVGARWESLADRWAALGGHGLHAFNDLHALLAYLGAGRRAQAEALIAAQHEALRRDDDNAVFTREVGQPLCLALVALERGDWAQAIDLLRGTRSHAHRFGGSHAQRDLIDLTLLYAADRGEDRALFLALASERVMRRPRNGLALRTAEAAGLPRLAVAA